MITATSVIRRSCLIIVSSVVQCSAAPGIWLLNTVKLHMFEHLVAYVRSVLNVYATVNLVLFIYFFNFTFYYNFSLHVSNFVVSHFCCHFLCILL